MQKRKSYLDVEKRSPVRVNPVLQHSRERRISLDGVWKFRLDPKDKGVRLGWFDKKKVFKDSIKVPGCWQGQGFGHNGKDEVWDFRLQERTFRATYEGTGWYSTKFRPPKEWSGLRIWINFGGVHPSAEIWLNGRKLGSHSAPFVPFAFDITDLVNFDRNNHLVVRVYEDNRWMGLSYNWQGKWSGLYRSVELTATGDPWLEKLWVHGDVDAGVLRLRAEAKGVGGESDQITLAVSAKPVGGAEVASESLKLEPGKEKGFALPIESPLLWSPDGPNLYQVDALLLDGDDVLDAVSERVGFVKLSTEGKRFLINDEPYYMRGSGDFIVNPETGCPDVDRKRWRRKLGTLREYGYNYVRCQSYVPTPEYYDAADEVGLLIQGEMGMLGAWSGVSPWHVYAWPQPSPRYRQMLKWQWDRTVMRDVNHPSAAIYCMSNELGKDTLYPRIAWQCCRDTKAIKPWAFVIWTDGGHNPRLPEDFTNAEASMDKQCKKPVIQHEFRWWSSYPDVRLKDKYREAIRPYAIKRAERMAAKNDMSQLLPAIAQNSQHLQYIEARAKMEACRRDHPNLAGISHFTAMDCGFSPQGIINDFYERKHADAATWRRTWGDAVVLLDHDFDDRVLAAAETLRCNFSVSDFSHPPLKNPVLEWELSSGKRPLASGQLAFRHRPFCTRRAGKIEAAIPEITVPLQAKLRATLREGDRVYDNEWDFWLFPREVELPSSIAIYRAPKFTWLRQLRDIERTDSGGLEGTNVPQVILSEIVDEALAQYMREGGRAVLAAGEGLVRPFTPKLGLTTGRYFFLPPANYPTYEDGNSGTIINEHPMLGDIPHDGFADLQFYRTVAESPPVDLRPFGGCCTEPVIRSFSTYFVCHPLAYLLEFKVGKGGLIISSLDLNQKWPEARYLLASILRYASGHEFDPKDVLSESAVQCILDAGTLP